MHLNADFSQRVEVDGGAIAWVPSPMPGVERRMLDRIGDEVARATSLVRYAPNSIFSPHTHGGGEEFLVLEGVFQDEHGAYGPGDYIRNPPGTSHRPRSDEGCVIFVKLWQFPPIHEEILRVRNASGPLFESDYERVLVENWTPNTQVHRQAKGGFEIFVITGSLVEGDKTHGPWSWIRLPGGETLKGVAGAEGARVWIKEGAVDGAAERFQTLRAR